MLAGRLSGDKVELGLVPHGRCLMGVFALALVAVRHSFALVHRRRGLPGDGQRTLRGPALRLHPAAQRCARKGPRRGRQQFLPDHRHARSPAPSCGSATPGCTSAPTVIMLGFGVSLLAGHRLHRDHGARLPGALRALAAHPQRLPHPHHGPGKRALPRTRAAGRQPHVACRWLPDRRLRAALHPLHGVEAHTTR